MTSVLNFITGTVYIGSYHYTTHTMDGFGVYSFPDGAEYRGFFKTGHFHGYGCLTVMKPVKLLYKGNFKNGKLVQIEEIVFADGLRVNCSIQDGELNMDNWTYCTSSDRRYSTELTIDLPAVGPDSHLTRLIPHIELKPNHYDMEEGLYNPHSGFVTQTSDDHMYERFVSCLKEKNWIRRCCRRGSNIQLPPLIRQQEERNIIINNLNESDTVETCTCNILKERKNIVCLKCKKENISQNLDEEDPEAQETEKVEQTDTKTSSEIFTDTSSTSAQTIEEVELKDRDTLVCAKINDTHSSAAKRKTIGVSDNLMTLDNFVFFAPGRLSDLSRFSKRFELIDYKN